MFITAVFTVWDMVTDVVMREALAAATLKLVAGTYFSWDTRLTGERKERTSVLMKPFNLIRRFCLVCKKQFLLCGNMLGNA